MPRKFLTHVDLAKNELQNAVVQRLAADPASPVAGQAYFNTASNKLRTFNGTTWDEYGTSTAAGTVTSVSVVNANGFNGTVATPNTTPAITVSTTATGVLKGDGTAISAAAAGTDFSAGTAALATGILHTTTTTGALKTAVAADFPVLNQNTTGTAANVTGTVAIANGGTGVATLPTGLLKGAGTGAITAAVASTDYAPATATAGALKGNGTGGFAAAVLNDVGAATAAYSLNNQRITNLANPTAAQDAATRNYVDLAVQGIDWKDAVRAASTANVALTTGAANASVIDGVTLATGNRILLKNQTAGAENGIYTVNATGAPTRSTDADTGPELEQASVFVREGTVNKDSAWVLTNDGAITLGTTALTFVQFSQSGGVQNATTTAEGITRYATSTEIEAATITTAAVTPSGLTAYAKRFSGTIGDGTATSIGVLHNLGRQFVTAQVFDATTFLQVDCDVTLTNSNTTTFAFTVAPTAGQYRVVIVG